MVIFQRFVAVLLIALFLQEAPPAAKTGTLTGELIPSAKTPPVTRPVKVILLTETYTNLFDGEALRRTDEYWERYKPAFIEQKELFYTISQLAQTEAVEYVISRMRQDGVDFSRMTRDSTPDGRFEFRNLPLGEYKIVAYGAAGSNEFVWQNWVNLENSEPVHVLLKTTLP